MTANTLMVYLKLKKESLAEEDTWKRLDDVFARYLPGEKPSKNIVNFGENTSGPDKLIILTTPSGSHLTSRIHGNGLITVDIQHLLTKKYVSFEDHPYNMEYLRQAELDVREIMGDRIEHANSLYAPIRRGQEVWPYAVSADERILEMDYEHLVHEKQSKYQLIRIFHSKECGNVLFLDGDSMLGESDLIYTRTLLCDGAETYKDKEILILGGGDGGLLHELLKEQPKFVTMAEIDEEVIKGCAKHMRSVCGDAMDKYDGPRHKIVIDDCVKILHESIQQGKQYDYVINDLTEFPVEKAVKGFGYDLETTSLITELSLKAIKPTGKVLARGNCWGAYEYRERFEGEMTLLNCGFKRRDVYVPSFRETYCLYEIWKL